MKKIILFVFATIFTFITFAQEVKLKIIDALNIKVENATLFDSTNRIFLVSDDEGVVRLKNKDYTFLITHILYKNKIIAVPKILKDTVILIALENKNELLETVSVVSKKKTRKGKYVDWGFYNAKREAKIIFRQNAKFGIVLRTVNEKGSKNELKSINFCMSDIKNDHSEFGILVSIYGINNDRISDTILNKTPIFYKSNDFKKINSISIEEKIFIPTEGVFISMQLSSSIENDNQFELTFPINLHSENEIFFIENSKDPKWDNTKISSKRGFFIKNDLQNYKFGMLKLGVTYYSY